MNPSPYWAKRLKLITPSENFRRDGTSTHFDINFGVWKEGRIEKEIDEGVRKILPAVQRCLPIREKYEMGSPYPAGAREILLDSKVGSPPDVLGMTITSLHFAYAIAELSRYAPLWPKRVTEIGGGFGGFARVFLSLHDRNRITLVDFQEMLDLQKWYLERHDLEERANFRLPDQSPIGSSDAFVNMTSMCEMTMDQIAHYIREAERTLLVGGLFLSVNHEHCVETYQSEWPWSPGCWELLHQQPFPHLPIKRGKFTVRRLVRRPS